MITAENRISMIEVSFKSLGDGRFYVGSRDLPGLHLSGDFATVCAGIVPAVEILIEKNHGLRVKATPMDDDWRDMNSPRQDAMPMRLALQVAA